LFKLRRYIDADVVFFPSVREYANVHDLPLRNEYFKQVIGFEPLKLLGKICLKSQRIQTCLKSNNRRITITTLTYENAEVKVI